MCMAASKHYKFIGAFPTPESIAVAKIVWQNGLASLSDQELSAGIKALADWKPENGEDRTPTLMEFKNLLCPRIPKPQLKIADNHVFVPAKPETAKHAWEDLNKDPKLKTNLKLALQKIIERNKKLEVN